MAARLASLEKLHNISPPAEAKPLAGQEPGLGPASIDQESRDAAASGLGEQDREPPRMTAGVEDTPPNEGRPAMQDWDWEQIIGGNWLARVGVLAVIIGVAFFLKLAFDNDWIGPAGRVALGIAGGLVMLGAGEFWHKRYPGYAQALSGGGIGLLYLATFAASAIYGLVGLYPAVAFLLLVSAASAVLALRYESMALAIIGIAGAFSAPFLLSGFDAEASSAAAARTGYDLIAYVLVVDAGVLALSTVRSWRWFRLIALLASLLSYVAWFGEFSNEAGALGAELAITAIFLVFVGVTTLFHLVWNRALGIADLSLVVVNAVGYLGLRWGALYDESRVWIGVVSFLGGLLYGVLAHLAFRRSAQHARLSFVALGIAAACFGMGLGALYDEYRAWIGSLSFLVALFYGALAYLTFRQSAQHARLVWFTISIAMVFLNIAVPAQFRDSAWTTIIWAALGTALVWLSFIARARPIRVYGYVVFAHMAAKLVVVDTPVNALTHEPVLNERVLAFLAGIAALYLSAYVVWRARGQLSGWEANCWSIYPLFLGIANLFTIWILTAEVIGYFDNRLSLLGAAERSGPVGQGLRSAMNLSLTTLWAVYASGLLIVGIAAKTRQVRLAGLGLLLVPVVKVFAYDVFQLEQIYRVVAFLGLGGLLLAGGYLYHRFSQAIRGFIVEG